MSIQVNLEKFNSFYTQYQKDNMYTRAQGAFDTLVNGTGRGNDFLGWIKLPTNVRPLLAKVKETALQIKSESEVLVVVGIGGSYLGARSAIEFMTSPNYNMKDRKGWPQIFFAGNNISGDYMTELMEMIGDRDFSVNIISKSGTTVEPALAFHFFEQALKEKYGDTWTKRVYVTTDAKKGDLRKFADKNGCVSFVVDDDIGGRFSVLSPVGLLPIACAGVDIDAIIDGAESMANQVATFGPENIAVQYAMARNLAYDNGKTVEILGSYEPRFRFMGEWWKQLFGESEGKDFKGIFPASVDLTADLHSMGQFIQEGTRMMFETIVSIDKPACDCVVENHDADFTRLDLFEGLGLNAVNKMAQGGTMIAHSQGGVPNILVSISDNSEFTYGELVYFFEFACGVSGYLLGVNPFDQPGVEAYKKEMMKAVAKG